MDYIIRPIQQRLDEWFGKSRDVYERYLKPYWRPCNFKLTDMEQTFFNTLDNNRHSI